MQTAIVDFISDEVQTDAPPESKDKDSQTVKPSLTQDSRLSLQDVIPIPKVLSERESQTLSQQTSEVDVQTMKLELFGKETQICVVQLDNESQTMVKQFEGYGVQATAEHHEVSVQVVQEKLELQSHVCEYEIYIKEVQVKAEDV